MTHFLPHLQEKYHIMYAEMPKVWASALLVRNDSESDRMPVTSSKLQLELEQRVHVRTGRQIRNLSIELTPGSVVLRGQTTTYYAKQLAQHGVRDLLPQVNLENAITVVAN